MNKKLLLIGAIAIMGQSVNAASKHKSCIAQLVCDFIAGVLPTLTSGQASEPLYAVLEKNEEKLKQGQFIEINGNKFAKDADGKAIPVTKDTPENDKAIFVDAVTANKNRDAKIEKQAQKYHYDFMRKWFQFRASSWGIERGYFLIFSAAALYGTGKMIQKLSDNGENDQKSIDFSAFEDEVENTVQKIKSATQS